MKKITGWVLKIEKGYREISFQFTEIDDAQGFLRDWVGHKVRTDKYDDGDRDKYTIAPVFEGEDQDDHSED